MVLRDHPVKQLIGGNFVKNAWQRTDQRLPLLVGLPLVEESRKHFVLDDEATDTIRLLTIHWYARERGLSDCPCEQLRRRFGRDAAHDCPGRHHVRCLDGM